MKCPYCNNNCPEDALYCDVCKQPLPVQEERDEGKRKRTPLQKLLRLLLWLVSLTLLFFGVYKLLNWIDRYEITRLYTRGANTPTINTVTMDDGRKSHALVFYGQDGERVFIPELAQSLEICGGTARLELPDSDWFLGKDEEYVSADICFVPVLTRVDGTHVQLPAINYTIEMPESPLEVISPATNDLNIVTSSYPLQLRVVPGSHVFVNGEDITDRIDRNGDFSGTVAVRPIGENVYTVVVRTANHLESRNDVIITRTKMDIEIELDSSVSNTSSEATTAVSGRVEPGAAISVDTDFIPESLHYDMYTGEFAFIAKFDHYGENIVRFRATMEGRKDAVISFPVRYKPTLAAISAKAWKMDYVQLRKYYENWVGRVFLCEGPLVDSYSENDEHFLVLDVGAPGTQELVILKNESSTSSVLHNASYSIYADVAGRQYYKDKYYPLLNAWYIDSLAAK